MTQISISGWKETFENAGTRKLKQLLWYPCPAGVDSSGYVALMSHGTPGVIAFGVFQAICQWSATSIPGVRGRVARSDGRDISVRQLATLLRIDQTTVSDAIELLTSPEVGWLTVDAPTSCDASPSHLPVVSQPSASDPPVASQSLPTEERRGEERRGQRGEERTTHVAVAPACPAQEILEAFDRTFGTRSIMTAKRKTALAARWREPFWRDHWRQALERAGPSTFLRGSNDRNWVIDFEFFLKPDSVAKILEGKYDNRTHQKAATGAAAREQRTGESFNALRRARERAGVSVPASDNRRIAASGSVSGASMFNEANAGVHGPSD